MGGRASVCRQSRATCPLAGTPGVCDAGHEQQSPVPGIDPGVAGCRPVAVAHRNPDADRSTPEMNLFAPGAVRFRWACPRPRL
jgi:hypothetical protein